MLIRKEEKSQINKFSSKSRYTEKKKSKIKSSKQKEINKSSRYQKDV